jgi:hypothetical protein
MKKKVGSGRGERVSEWDSERGWGESRMEGRWEERRVILEAAVMLTDRCEFG